MELPQDIQNIIPPLTAKQHKGSLGRIGIFGGGDTYCGAPYFAATSAMRVGCDGSFVFCGSDTWKVIASYSPDLIVHGILDCRDFREKMSLHLSYLHSLVIGPGLGRQDSHITKNFFTLVKMAKEKSLPIVLDADALFHLNSSPESLKGYTKAILTPNRMELSRLYKAVFGVELKVEDISSNNVKELASEMGNVTIVSKGESDIITDGESVLSCSEEGSYRRINGQGDILSGSMGIFNHWAHQTLKQGATIAAAMAACSLVRRCNHLVFKRQGRNMVTSDMLSEIPRAFASLFPEK